MNLAEELKRRKEFHLLMEVRYSFEKSETGSSLVFIRNTELIPALHRDVKEFTFGSLTNSQEHIFQMINVTCIIYVCHEQ